jgi:hypothetical protein
MADPQNQIVYVLTNPAMPGLVKIGKTTQLEVDMRMKQLYGTGVPVPFDCVYACRVKDASKVEEALHFAFGTTRINPNREFFRVEPERVQAILELLKVDDVTREFEEKLESDVTAVDRQSAQILKEARRPRMNFHELNIPDGSVLVSKDGKHQAIVVGDRKVQFNDEEMSLTAATRKMLERPDDYPLQPSPHWTFNGKTVKELYEATHASADEN